MIDWIKTVHSTAASVAVIYATVVAWWNLGLPRLVLSPELAPIHARIEALEQFNRDTRSWCSTRPWWSANPIGMLWLEMGAAFATSDGGGPPAAPWAYANEVA